MGLINHFSPLYIGRKFSHKTRVSQELLSQNSGVTGTSLAELCVTGTSLTEFRCHRNFSCWTQMSQELLFVCYQQQTSVISLTWQGFGVGFIHTLTLDVSISQMQGTLCYTGWILLSWISLSWIRLSWIHLSLIHLSWILLSWILLSWPISWPLSPLCWWPWLWNSHPSLLLILALRISPFSLVANWIVRLSPLSVLVKNLTFCFEYYIRLLGW